MTKERIHRISKKVLQSVIATNVPYKNIFIILDPGFTLKKKQEDFAEKKNVSK